MDRRSPLRSLTELPVRHPVAALSAVAVLAGILALGLPRLDFSSGQDTLVPADSPVLQQTRRLQAQFGDSPVLVLLEGEVRDMLSPGNRARLAELEERLLASGQFHSVVGPHTSIQLAMAVADLPLEAAEDPALVELVVFDDEGAVRPQLRGQIPDDHHALLTARPIGGLSLEEQSAAVALVERAVAAAGLEGVSVTVTGPQALLRELTEGMREAMARMGLVAVAAMAAVLLLFAPGRWRLLPLLAVLVGTASAFGVFGFTGIVLSMVTISGLPVLLGMGVDFAIQSHSRYGEEREKGRELPGLATLDALGPGLVVALLAAVAGFVSLRLSPVPMISDYGTMLAIGVAVLFLVGIAVTIAALTATERIGTKSRSLPVIVVEPAIRRVAGSALGRPGLIAVAALLIAVTGLGVDLRTDLASDPERFVPRDSSVLAELDRVRSVTGSSSEISFLVEAEDVTRPEVATWLAEFAEEQRSRHPEITAAASFASLAAGLGGVADPDAVEAVLGAAPPSLRRMLLDSERTSAHLVFAIANVPLAETERIISAVTSAAQPPAGVSVAVGGLSALGIETVNALRTNRVFMVHLALLGAGLCLLVLTRSVTWALLPLLPVLVAVGTAALVVAGLGVELSPLAAVAGPLIVAVCCEFSVLLCARYVEARQRGQSCEEAVGEAAGRIGSAFCAAGLTTTAGFGALALSGFPLLESFGLVVAVNVLVALGATLVALPPLLIWADERVGLLPVQRLVATRSPGAIALLEPVPSEG